MLIPSEEILSKWDLLDSNKWQCYDVSWIFQEKERNSLSEKKLYNTWDCKPTLNIKAQIS